MSEAVRTEISAAANSVAGVRCLPWYRQATKAGEAMVRLDRIEYPNSLAGLCYWQVLVIMPQDVGQAEKWLEARADALVDALAETMAVDTLTPQELVLDNGTKLPVVVIAGTRER
jgi:hypothetical protein